MIFTRLGLLNNFCCSCLLTILQIFWVFLLKDHNLPIWIFGFLDQLVQVGFFLYMYTVLIYVCIYYINTLLAGKVMGFWFYKSLYGLYTYIWFFWILGLLIKLVFFFFFFLFPKYLKFWTQFDFVSFFSSHIHYDCWFMIVVSIAFILFWWLWVLVF